MSYTSLLTQTCTYWSPATPDGFGGMTFAAPTTLLCRWQEETDIFQDTAGEEFISDATIYTGSVLVENGWLYLGTSVAADPQTVDGAYRIRRLAWSQTPNASIVVYKWILG